MPVPQLIIYHWQDASSTCRITGKMPVPQLIIYHWQDASSTMDM
ncbi:hypothetical protein [Moorena bouillonii]|nr:hypothetical protein [Moorena bouillonii]